jgi:hypothetical protein
MEVPGKLYSNLFSTPPTDGDVYVESLIWNELIQGLPESYTIPDELVLAPMLYELQSM